MKKLSARGQLIRDTIDSHPDAPKRTLARLLHDQFPEEFPSVENARSSIRFYTGAKGPRQRKHIPRGEVDIRKPTTLKIPRGERQARRTLTVKESGKFFVSSDWHVPYHDDKAIEAALRFAVDAGCEHFYLNGDGIDFYQLSRFERDPRRRSTAKELSVFWDVIDEVLPHFSGSKFYKLGNHEDRLTKQVWKSTPQLAVLKRFNVDEVLELGKRGLRVIHSKQLAKLGEWWLLHGHELSNQASSPVSVSRGVLTRVKTNAIVGHWHKTSTHVDTNNLLNKVTVCHSLGCLCDRSPDYAVVNDWNPGFAIIENGGGSCSVKNYLLDRGKVVQAA